MEWREQYYNPKMFGVRIFLCFLYISPFLTQAMLMAGTVIGPGTIFLMLVGAFVAAFKISNWYSFYYNLMPILIYTLVCLTCRTSIQVKILNQGFSVTNQSFLRRKRGSNFYISITFFQPLRHACRHERCRP